MNNSHLAFIDPVADTARVTDVFVDQNGIKLGDTGNDMLVYNGDIYVVMNASKMLYRLNGSGVLKASYSGFDNDKLGEPRFAIADNGKLYVTCYGGYVARFNAQTLAFEDSVAVDGNPEEIVVLGNDLYCVCSGWGYGKTICKVDKSSFAKSESIETLPNPTNLKTANGHLYVQSGGTYNPDYSYDQMPSVGIFNPETRETKKIADATKMLPVGDKLYFVNSISPDWVSYETTLSFYDTRTGEVNKWELTNCPAEVYTSTVYMVEQNPYTGDFYLGVTDFKTGTTLYRFSASGTFQKKIALSVISPNSMAFLY
ncbi:MAG: hypothetical protein IJS97_04530 [Prevotella sp.]|nr:hypothetical protein [Prevotella sp.]